MSGRSGSGPGWSRRLAVLLGAVTVVSGLALAGCSAGGEDSGSAVEPNSAVEQANPEQPAVGGAAPAEGQPNQPARDPDAPELAVNQRAIVYTGSITIRVDDVDQKAAQAAAIATGAGGFVGGDTRSSDPSSAEATLQLRVPADRFTAAVDALAGLGSQLRRDIKTDDVTEETLDLDARLATQRARVENGRRLLAQAKSLSDLVMLEGELARREADLASLEAKKRRLADLTALSTITAVLLGPNAEDDTRDEPATGFVAGLKGGWRAFVASLEILLTVLGALLPWLVALGLPAVGVGWLVRRLRRRRRPAPMPARPNGPVSSPGPSASS
ncbi:DUF4349 domain-containing protein [Plantactinospora sonchi]|uniref:DUF4349 domain-containing protein n=1 Tax=Plantactinospora sonchi TaxID=1544735 RepID=A0ABU7RSV1_9ACTN